jgi:hypothetical protein
MLAPTQTLHRNAMNDRKSALDWRKEERVSMRDVSKKHPSYPITPIDASMLMGFRRAFKILRAGMVRWRYEMFAASCEV